MQIKHSHTSFIPSQQHVTRPLSMNRDTNFVLTETLSMK